MVCALSLSAAAIFSGRTKESLAPPSK
jgi:hypothetical protein